MKHTFKSGFVAVIGRPNVGKSTLINRIVGQKIAIVSDKPQTTRSRILAIKTTEEYQIVFVDTPGIHRPRNKLGQHMVKAATESAQDADLIVMVTEAGATITNNEKNIVNEIKNTGIPALLVINKIDTIEKERLLPQISAWSNEHSFEEILPLSARSGSGVETCLQEIVCRLQEGPAFYPEDMVTDIRERDLAAEVIREKALRLLGQEIPHGIAVEVNKFIEQDSINKIYATIYCEKESHKGIIIGKNGDMLKRIGSSARENLERLQEKKVYLQLWVKVKTDWRNSESTISDLGLN